MLTDTPTVTLSPVALALTVSDAVPSPTKAVKVALPPDGDEDELNELLTITSAFEITFTSPPTPFSSVELISLNVPVGFVTVSEHDSLTLPEKATSPVFAAKTTELPNTVVANITDDTAAALLNILMILPFQNIEEKLSREILPRIIHLGGDIQLVDEWLTILI